MRQRHILRALTVVLACFLLSAAALACMSGNEETESELARINGIATKNLVELEVLQARLSQMEEANTALSDRVAALEGENQQLVHRISVLEGITGAAGAAITAAAVSALGAAYDAASDADRQLVREFLECTMKAGGVDATTIAAMLPESEMMTWQNIDAGEQTIEQLQMMHSLVCPK